VEKASVVIPAHNDERFIERTIRTALEQTCTEKEIIIVDDASEDRTASIVECLRASSKEARIRYERNGTCRGVSYSRNKGFDVSGGAFVFFLDHDDCWKPHYMESILSTLSSPNVDIAYSFPRTFIDEEDRVIRTSRKKIPGDVGAIVFSGSIGYATATALKREAFLRYDESLSGREDWELFLRSFLQGKRVSVVDSDLVMIRSHRGRMSRRLGFWRSTREVYSMYVNRIPEAYRAHFLFQIAEVCMRFGDLPFGWKLVSRAIRAKPDLLLQGRNVLSILKRGARLDRYFGLREERDRLLRIGADGG
jgi:glycosyltransferase involved in cell wall biosynthesis